MHWFNDGSHILIRLHLIANNIFSNVKEFLLDSFHMPKYKICFYYILRVLMNELYCTFCLVIKEYVSFCFSLKKIAIEISRN